MPSIHQHSCLSANICSSKEAKESLHKRASDLKWIRVVVLLCLVASCMFFWVSISSDHGKLESLLLTEEASRDSMDNCTEKVLYFDDTLFCGFLHATELLNNCGRGLTISFFACYRESGCRVPPSSTISCALKFLDSENPVFRRQCEFVTENIELRPYCPSIEGAFGMYPRLPSSEVMSTLCMLNATFSSAHPSCENELQMRELNSHATYHCEGIYIRLAENCLWILIGMSISYKLRGLYERLRSQKHEMRQQETLLQQPQLQPQARCSSQSTGKWRKKLLVVFVLGGVITSFSLFWFMNEDIMLRRKETLASMCDERARMLQDQFNVSMNHVHALAILVSTFHHGAQPSAIDQNTFEDYTERTAFERPLTSGVAYALRIRHSERERIEQQYGWTIKKMDVEDQTLAQDCNPESFTTSPAQDEYAPVIFSQKTVSHIVSIDMMSGKEDRDNILRARASGKGVLTSPFKLLKSNHLGVVLTFAVYNTNLPLNATPEERINATVGYLGAAYDVPSLVEKLLHQLASKQTIIVNVYDTTNQAAPINMYGSDVVDTGVQHISHLDFGDPTRKHEMHCRFKQKHPPPWQAIAASVGVLVITLLLGHIFRAALIQIAKVEHDYREMMELKHRAEAAGMAKSQFLATVSHEIRTPMNGVLGMLQMLMDTNLDACQLNYAQTAHDSGKDLISLINKVLDQAKIESGMLELESVPFDVRAVLDKVLSIFSGKSHEKRIELAVYVSDQVPEVLIGDQERFGQIITNLVGNSIKFTHNEGHIFVSVHLADEVKSSLDVKDEVLRQSLNAAEDGLNAAFNTLSGFRVVDRWRSWENFGNLGRENAEETGKIKLLVTVEDTGTGIPPEAQGRIFTPFMQADSSTSRKYGGTGIGLSISKRLIGLMAGEIGFVSEPDIGSTFTFTVTFTKAETSSLEKIWQPCDPAVSEFQGLRALVIDEKRIRAQVTKYHLQRLGMYVDISSSMESACSRLLSNSETSIEAECKEFAMVLIDQEYWDDYCFRFDSLMRHRRQVGSPLKIFFLASSISSSECIKLKLVDALIVKPLRLSVLVSNFQGKRRDTIGKACTLRSLLKGKQMLVVDDNAVNRRVAEGALKKYGAVISCVEGGKAAVELLKPPHMFDACFMDLQMPEMDGFEATRQIRKVEKEYNGGGWHTPIVAMTADVIQANHEACIKCGMDEYVSKPFGEGELYSAVARFFL